MTAELARDPNITPETWERLAWQFPFDGYLNPARELFALEDPNRAWEILEPRIAAAWLPDHLHVFFTNVSYRRLVRQLLAIGEIEYGTVIGDKSDWELAKAELNRPEHDSLAWEAAVAVVSSVRALIESLAQAQGHRVSFSQLMLEAIAARAEAEYWSAMFHNDRFHRPTATIAATHQRRIRFLEEEENRLKQMWKYLDKIKVCVGSFGPRLTLELWRALFAEHLPYHEKKADA